MCISPILWVHSTQGQTHLCNQPHRRHKHDGRGSSWNSTLPLLPLVDPLTSPTEVAMMVALVATVLPLLPLVDPSTNPEQVATTVAEVLAQSWTPAPGWAQAPTLPG